MTLSTALTKTTEEISQATLIAKSSVAVQLLKDQDESEVLTFLARRPIHTVIMAGWIRDNGLVSPLNRGSFFGCRNSAGRLEGVALIGEITLLEARSSAALAAFASLAQHRPDIYMVMGEQRKIEQFWSRYAKAGQALRLFCRELLFELTRPVEVPEFVSGLRPATLDDLELVMPVHAEMAFEESGVDPRVADPRGFQRRCARRIEQGRVWVWIERGQLIFKADIISDTPEVIYLEGIHICPAERGKGYGLRCLSQLSNHLLVYTKSICLLVNEQNRDAETLYRRCDFKLRSYYDTIFLRQGN